MQTQYSPQISNILTTVYINRKKEEIERASLTHNVHLHFLELTQRSDEHNEHNEIFEKNR